MRGGGGGPGMARGRPTAFETLRDGIQAADLERFRPEYLSVVWTLAGLSTVTEPYVRPSASRPPYPFVQTSFPEIRRDKLTPGRELDKSDFADAACRRRSPYHDADEAASRLLDSDLRAAIDAHVTHGSDIVALRTERFQVLRSLALRLEPMRAACDAQKSACAARIAASFNAAWAAAVIDAFGVPDVALPLGYVLGFPCIFEVPDSGMYAAVDYPAEISEAEFVRNNTRTVAHITRKIERSATRGDANEKERRRQCWKRTKQEIAEGLISQPRSRAFIDRKFKRGKWRCIGRNAIYQKGKYRCIDDARRSKHNKATYMHETITTARADFPIVVTREFARRLGAFSSARRRHRGNMPGVRKLRRFKMRHGTNDLKSAYRRVPTAQPEYTVVAVWNDDAKRVEYCEVWGLNFGLLSAVTTFNRFPRLSVMAARRLMWIVTEHYFDDNDTCEPDTAGDTGQRYLVALSGPTFFGFDYDPDQVSPMSGSNEFLGVLSDLSECDQGRVFMDVTASRRDKIRALLDEVELARGLSSGLASSIFGKSRFMISPYYNNVGKACLQPIMHREHDHSAFAIDQPLQDSLDFVRYAADHLPPMEMLVSTPSTSERVVVFVDAEGKKRAGTSPPSGHVGFVVYHPTKGRCHGFSKVPSGLVKLMDRIKVRETYIGQFELIGAIVPFLSLPHDWFRGQHVELWIDNTMAIGGLLKGYSGKPDCARIINMFYFTFASLQAASLWIDYVPTDSNPADTPSRFHEMPRSEVIAAQKKLGRLVRAKVPDFADGQGNWRSFKDVAASVWGRSK